MAGNKLILDVDGLTVGLTQLTATGGDISVGQNLTVNGNLTINGYINGVALEYYDIRNSAPGPTEAFYLNQNNVWFTAANYTNIMPNFQGLANYAVGSVFYFNIFVTNGGKAFGIEAVRVDYQNVGVTTKWLGQSTPSFSANSIDCYNFQIIKTGAATYTVFGSKAQF